MFVTFSENQISVINELIYSHVTMNKEQMQADVVEEVSNPSRAGSATLTCCSGSRQLYGSQLARLWMKRPSNSE